MEGATCLHVDLDGAWPRDAIWDSAYFDARRWGPQLRFSAPAQAVERFHDEIKSRLARFTLYGSGDFHHLAALWLRGFSGPFTLVSFDNHPDWDLRPPRWGCGGWLRRAFDHPALKKAIVWGCGSAEFRWPLRLFADRRSLLSGRLAVHPWAERLPKGCHRLWPGVGRQQWRESFRRCADSLRGQQIYVTVDIDCVRREETVTNWDQGLFTVDDLVWALRELRANADVFAGDLCGAYSPPCFARFKQRLASTSDHPRLPHVDPAESSRLNLHALRTIWPALTVG